MISTTFIIHHLFVTTHIRNDFPTRTGRAECLSENSFFHQLLNIICMTNILSPHTTFIGIATTHMTGPSSFLSLSITPALVFNLSCSVHFIALLSLLAVFLRHSFISCSTCFFLMFGHKQPTIFGQRGFLSMGVGLENARFSISFSLPPLLLSSFILRVFLFYLVFP